MSVLIRLLATQPFIFVIEAVVWVSIGIQLSWNAFHGSVMSGTRGGLKASCINDRINSQRNQHIEEQETPRSYAAQDGKSNET